MKLEPKVTPTELQCPVFFSWVTMLVLLHSSFWVWGAEILFRFRKLLSNESFLLSFLLTFLPSFHLPEQFSRNYWCTKKSWLSFSWNKNISPKHNVLAGYNYVILELGEFSLEDEFIFSAFSCFSYYLVCTLCFSALHQVRTIFP